MEFIQTTFTINDLENLSGVKKHTIRIWEKRYNLLAPERTDTNIRNYSSASLIRLLNIVLLYNNGYKISKIGSMDADEILEHCRALVDEHAKKDKFINDMKVAMLHFDQSLFEKTYQTLNAQNSFSEIFIQYFMPFLNEIGMLWHTGTINPAHEHFISSLMKQKVLLQTEHLGLQTAKAKKNKFVLFLPDNEMHDLGITYLNYELRKSGYPTIYLGQMVPIDSLSSFTKPPKTNLIYISYFTVKPDLNKLQEYLVQFDKEVLIPKKAKLWVMGHQAQQIDTSDLSKRIKVFNEVKDVLNEIGM